MALHSERLSFKSGKEIINFYNAKRDEAQFRNCAAPGEDGYTVFDGLEGYVFYLKDMNNVWHMLKCKPEIIEDIHWASAIIPWSHILPTVMNSLESEPEPSVAATQRLLAEVFTQAQIDASTLLIEKAVDLVKERQEFQGRVMTAYKETGLDIEQVGKEPILRALSTSFQRKEMKKVFLALKDLDILKTNPQK